MTQLSFEVTRRDEVTSPERIAEILENPGLRQDLHRPHGRRDVDGRRRLGRRAGAAHGPFQLDPAAAVRHYAQEIFEGMKAYRHADGSIWTFRPEEAARFARSAASPRAARAARGRLHRVAAPARLRRPGLGAGG